MALVAAAAACGGPRREPLVTYFNGDYGISVRYPASWKTDQAEQDGMWYRYFLGPPSGPDRKPAVSVTLLAGPLPGSLDDYAQTYLAGNTLATSREETRQGAKGRAYDFSSKDGATRFALLILQEEQRVYGLYSQGGAALFDQHRGTLEEMAQSLTLERPPAYREHRDEKFGFAVRLPPSWRETRRFSGGGTMFVQFASPAIGADKGHETVHATLTVSVEPAPGDGAVATYYQATKDKLGEAYRVLSHTPWRDGYVDVMRVETPVTVSRIKRFYRVGGGRGYSLVFEVRDDVFGRVSRWCDMIAGTLRVAGEVQAK
ncbi:MAG: hypothetical protein HY317_05190 [Acidobacteria bacterium]|nr:hypothetical protein [Acidobacteriota bacterium]